MTDKLIIITEESKSYELKTVTFWQLILILMFGDDDDNYNRH